MRLGENLSGTADFFQFFVCMDSFIRAFAIEEVLLARAISSFAASKFKGSG